MKAFFSTMLAACLLVACSSSDDDLVVSATGLTGMWDLVEVQNGPEGRCEGGYAKQYPSGTVIIGINENGKMVFVRNNGKTETLDYTFPEDQEPYASALPVMNIGDVPFSYAIEGNRLKLHYLGVYYCDHIPATFVFTRLSNIKNFQ